MADDKTPLEKFEVFVSEILTVSKDDISEVEETDSEEPATEGDTEGDTEE